MIDVNAFEPETILSIVCSYVGSCMVARKINGRLQLRVRIRNLRILTRNCKCPLIFRARAR